MIEQNIEMVWFCSIIWTESEGLLSQLFTWLLFGS